MPGIVKHCKKLYRGSLAVLWWVDGWRKGMRERVDGGSQFPS